MKKLLLFYIFSLTILLNSITVYGITLKRQKILDLSYTDTQKSIDYTLLALKELENTKNNFVKANYNSTLSYIYKSVLDYKNFKKYSQLAFQLYLNREVKSKKNDGILLNYIRTKYEFGNYQSAIETLSDTINLQEIACNKKNSFFYIEYAYILSLKGKNKKAYNIKEKCSKHILEMSNISIKFRKNVYFMNALINSRNNDIKAFNTQINLYDESTPKSIYTDKLLSGIAKVCANYTNDNYPKALEAINNLNKSLVATPSSINKKNYYLIKDELTSLIKGSKTKFSGKYGHWNDFCTKK